MEAWRQEGLAWRTLYDQRHQHVMSRMNHHIHPLVNEHTGERRVLGSCVSKNKPGVCKSGFPLENEMTDSALVVCLCIAHKMNLCTTGPRSLLGTILPERNDPWQNAGPSAWLTFSGDNGDIKFPHRLPLQAETHEQVGASQQAACISSLGTVQLTFDMQAGQAAAAGYFGGYTAKMEEMGKKELEHIDM